MLTYSRSGIRSRHSDPAHAEYRLSVQFFEELCSTFYRPLPAQCWLFAGSASANTENCGHFLFTGRDSLFPPVVVIFPHVVVITQSFACRAALLRCLSTGGEKWERCSKGRGRKRTRRTEASVLLGEKRLQKNFPGATVPAYCCNIPQFSYMGAPKR